MPEVPARAQQLSRRPPRAQTRLVDSLRLSFTVVIVRLSTTTSGPHPYSVTSVSTHHKLVYHKLSCTPRLMT